MLTTSPQILARVKRYTENDFFKYSDDEQALILNTDTAASWIEDDEFLMTLLFSGPDLNSTVDIVLEGRHRSEVAVKLESRIVPNAITYLRSLGYNPEIYVLTSLILRAPYDTILDTLLVSVDIVDEPVNQDCLIAETELGMSLSISQPQKLTKKRKQE